MSAAGDVLEGHRAYRAVLLAMARPGRPQPMPDASDPGAAATLILRSTWTADDPRVVVVDGDVEPAALLSAHRGTDERPEDGATVIVVVDRSAAPTASVRLTGPGVDGSLDVRLPLSAGAIEARAEACADWPRGIDIVFVVPGPAVIGLPRTTRVEVA